MLRIFTPVKIQRLRLGLNTQTWVPEASMLTTRPPKPSTVHVKQTFNYCKCSQAGNENEINIPALSTK